MINDKFKEAVASYKGAVVVIAGSNSDEEHIGKVVKALRDYALPREVRVCSAHKQPQEAMNLLEEYDGLEGSLVYLTIAGGTDALSGLVSYHTHHPVVSCPPDSRPPEHNQSCLNNPPGSSCAYIARPKNAARFIAQIFAGRDEHGILKNKLHLKNERKREELEMYDEEFREKYGG